MPAGWPQNQVTKAARAASGGGFESAIESSPVSGFVAESGFSLADNGDGTLSVTDSQSRFGTKPNAAKPVWFLDFSSGSDQPHPTLSRQQKTLSWAAQCAPTSSVSKSGSSHSMTLDTASMDQGNSCFTTGDDTLNLPSNSGRKYFRATQAYRSWTAQELFDASTSGANNQKKNRWQYSGVQSEPYTVVTLQNQNYDWEFSGSTNQYIYDIRNMATGVWEFDEEYHEVSSGAGVLDASAKGVINGATVFSQTGADSHKGFDPSVYQWTAFKISNWRFWAPTGVCPWQHDFYYIDDSWCRVYITDKPTWSTAETKAMEIQVPVGWAAGQVDFHQRTGAFGSLSGKYLWVVDNDDTKILVGGWS